MLEREENRSYQRLQRRHRTDLRGDYTLIMMFRHVFKSHLITKAMKLTNNFMFYCLIVQTTVCSKDTGSMTLNIKSYDRAEMYMRELYLTHALLHQILMIHEL